MTPIKLGFVMAALFALGAAYLTQSNQAVSATLVGLAGWLIGAITKEAGAKPELKQ